MGGKFADRTAGAPDIKSFLDSIPEEHRATFNRLHALVREVAPAATENLKWGTMSFDMDGSLFALSAAKHHVNLYILTLGVIARHKDLLTGIPQSKCVLRFSPDMTLPLGALRTVMRAAVAAKSP